MLCFKQRNWRSAPRTAHQIRKNWVSYNSPGRILQLQGDVLESHWFGPHRPIGHCERPIVNSCCVCGRALLPQKKKKKPDPGTRLQGVILFVHLEEWIDYLAQPGLIRPSYYLSVHASRLGIQQKMAQAQQIWSIILWNHESTWIVNQKFFETKRRTPAKKSRKIARFLQPMQSKCFLLSMVHHTLWKTQWVTERDI